MLKSQRLGHELDAMLRRELHAVDLAIVLAHGQLVLGGARTERLQPHHVLISPSVGHFQRRRVVRRHTKRADGEDALVPGQKRREVRLRRCVRGRGRLLSLPRVLDHVETGYILIVFDGNHVVMFLQDRGESAFKPDL